MLKHQIFIVYDQTLDDRIVLGSVSGTGECRVVWPPEKNQKAGSRKSLSEEWGPAAPMLS